MGKNVMEHLRDELYHLALLHQYNLLHPNIIRKSQELDLLLNEITHVKRKGCQSKTTLLDSTE